MSHHVGDVRLLPADDEPASRPDLRFQLELARFPNAGFDLLLHLLEQWLEMVKILAAVAVRNLLGRSLVGAGTNMTEFGDLRIAGSTGELREEFIVADVV